MTKLNIFRAILFLGVYAVTGVVTADCNSIPSATGNNVDKKALNAVFQKILSACASNQPENYFSLLTSPVRDGIISKLSKEEKQESFKQYCKFTNDANIALGGKPEDGLHSIEQDADRFTHCGKRSYWFIRKQQGDIVFRLKIAQENGQIKINDR